MQIWLNTHSLVHVVELDTDDELDMLDLNVHSVDCSVRLHVRPFYFIGLSLVHNLHYVSMSKSKLMLDYENTILKCKHSELNRVLWWHGEFKQINGEKLIRRNMSGVENVSKRRLKLNRWQQWPIVRGWRLLWLMVFCRKEHLKLAVLLLQVLMQIQALACSSVQATNPKENRGERRIPDRWIIIIWFAFPTLKLLSVCLVQRPVCSEVTLKNYIQPKFVKTSHIERKLCCTRSYFSCCQHKSCPPPEQLPGSNTATPNAFVGDEASLWIDLVERYPSWNLERNRWMVSVPLQQKLTRWQHEH